MIRECCVCHRVEQKGKWHADLIFGRHERLSHGYCPDCYDDLMVNIEEFSAIFTRKVLSTASRTNAEG
ncbi:MAG: hypothetical protein FWD79_07935 [Desulfobulbus sp.]|nr:hypothetical protein [Desulfobulbus sp.]